MDAEQFKLNGQKLLDKAVKRYDDLVRHREDVLKTNFCNCDLNTCDICCRVREIEISLYHLEKKYLYE